MAPLDGVVLNCAAGIRVRPAFKVYRRARMAVQGSASLSDLLLFQFQAVFCDRIAVGDLG